MVRCRVGYELFSGSSELDPVAKLGTTLGRPPALRALFVAVSPCLDPTDADYSCEVDEDGDL